MLKNLDARVAISSVAILVSSMAIYSLSSRKPRGLEGVPQVSFTDSMWYYVNGSTAYADKNGYVISKLPENGRRMFLTRRGLDIILHIASPEAAKVFYDQSNFKKYITNGKSLGFESFFKYLLGDNIATINDPDWSRHRKVIRPAFARPLRLSVFTDGASRFMRSLHSLKDAEKRDVDIYTWMQRLTLDVLGQGVFSFDFLALSDPYDSGMYVKQWNMMMDRIFEPAYALFPMLCYLPTKWNYDTWKVCKDFRDVLLAVYNDRMKDRTAGKVKNAKDMDILDLMIEEQITDSAGNWTMHDVASNVFAFFLAGHDTTANVLSAAVYLMAKHPEVQDKARAEVYSVLGKPADKDDAIRKVPEQADLTKLVYINAIMKETIRLFPSITESSPRKAQKDVPISYVNSDGKVVDLVIRKGTIASVNTFAMQHDPVYYPDPFAFKPDRWLDDHDSDGPKPWSPFGGGARICLGMQFSQLEQRVTLAMLLRNFEFHLSAKDVKKEYIVGPNTLLRPVGVTIDLKPLV